MDNLSFPIDNFDRFAPKLGREDLPNENQLEKPIHIKGPKESKEGENHPVLKTADRIEEVIARLHAASASGSKLGIFVGRNDDQSIPNEEGWTWCSLDRAPTQNGLAENRLHLRMSFNDEDEMKKIQGIFDKVVLDRSVIKFMDDPWITLKNLLVLKPHAELVTESWAGVAGVENEGKYIPEKAIMMIPMEDFLLHDLLKKRAFNRWKQKTGEEKVEAFYQEFVSRKAQEKEEGFVSSGFEQDLKSEFQQHILETHNIEPKPIDRVPELLQHIQNHLLGLFKEVELVPGPYPYIGPNNEERYWTARHPI